jgi:hypothetical protein
MPVPFAMAPPPSHAAGAIIPPLGRGRRDLPTEDRASWAELIETTSQHSLSFFSHPLEYSEAGREVSHDDNMLGKPVIRGTRITVELILRRAEKGHRGGDGGRGARQRAQSQAHEALTGAIPGR